MTRSPCSCVILAGGESKRFQGKNKAFIKLGGQRVLDRLIGILKPLFSEVILVTNDPLLYLEWNVMIVTDHFDCRSSLTGIHAGLFAASNPHALVVACDMPFVQSRLLEVLINAIEPHLDVIIPKTSDGFEPMTAIYSKRCLKPMEAALAKNQFQILKVLKHMRLKEIEEAVSVFFRNKLKTNGKILGSNHLFLPVDSRGTWSHVGDVCDSCIT